MVAYVKLIFIILYCWALYGPAEIALSTALPLPKSTPSMHSFGLQTDRFIAFTSTSSP